MLVSFVMTRDGKDIMTRIAGRIAFPDKRWPYDPNALIDIWGAPLDGFIDVVITGENPTKTVYFVAPKHLFQEFEHNGFECSGSMCSTTALGFMVSKEGFKDTKGHLITPGRLERFLKIANNVNVGWNGRKSEELIPGIVWCEKPKDKRFWRVVGIDLEELTNE